MRSLWACAVLVVGATGCSTAPFRTPSPQSPPNAPARETTPPPQAAASTALLQQSREARGAGRYQEAAASLERALRIDPNNALLWIELAEIKAEDGDRGQAREMARKALTLAAGDGSIEARARRLL